MSLKNPINSQGSRLFRQLSSTYSILASLFIAMLYDDTINVILCLWVMFSVLMVLIKPNFFVILPHTKPCKKD